MQVRAGFSVPAVERPVVVLVSQPGPGLVYVDVCPLLQGWRRREVPEGAKWESKFGCLVVGHTQQSYKCLKVFPTLTGKNKNHSISY